MADDAENKPRLVSVSHPSWNRTRRRQLPALLRNLLVALFGCLVAVLAFSALRAMNF